MCTGGSQQTTVILVPVSVTLVTPQWNWEWLQEAIEDTTGAGDAFIGTILYGITHRLPHDKMLQLAAVVAACKCTALGARPGLPHADAIDADMLIA